MIRSNALSQAVSSMLGSYVDRRDNLKIIMQKPLSDAEENFDLPKQIDQEDGIVERHGSEASMSIEH